MKPLLDLEQPFDPHAPGEVGWSFEANDPRLRRNHRVRPARPPMGIEELPRIDRVAFEPRMRMPVAIAVDIDPHPPHARHRCRHRTEERRDGTEWVSTWR